MYYLGVQIHVHTFLNNRCFIWTDNITRGNNFCSSNWIIIWSTNSTCNQFNPGWVSQNHHRSNIRWNSTSKAWFQSWRCNKSASCRTWWDPTSIHWIWTGWDYTTICSRVWARWNHTDSHCWIWTWSETTITKWSHNGCCWNQYWTSYK